MTIRTAINSDSTVVRAKAVDVEVDIQAEGCKAANGISVQMHTRVRLRCIDDNLNSRLKPFSRALNSGSVRLELLQ
jgi:hypothetical protein